MKFLIQCVREEDEAVDLDKNLWVVFKAAEVKVLVGLN